MLQKLVGFLFVTTMLTTAVFVGSVMATPSRQDVPKEFGGSTISPTKPLPVVICHPTGNPEHPYVRVEKKAEGRDGYFDDTGAPKPAQSGDILNPAAGVCPKAANPQVVVRPIVPVRQTPTMVAAAPHLPSTAPTPKPTASSHPSPRPSSHPTITPSGPSPKADPADITKHWGRLPMAATNPNPAGPDFQPYLGPQLTPVPQPTAHASPNLGSPRPSSLPRGAPVSAQPSPAPTGLRDRR